MGVSHLSRILPTTSTITKFPKNRFRTPASLPRSGRPRQKTRRRHRTTGRHLQPEVNETCAGSLSHTGRFPPQYENAGFMLNFLLLARLAFCLKWQICCCKCRRHKLHTSSTFTFVIISKNDFFPIWVLYLLRSNSFHCYLINQLIKQFFGDTLTIRGTTIR